MKLTLFNNSLNHHQVNVADELYKLLGEEFCYVATVSRDKIGLKGGIDYSSRNYCILAGESPKGHDKALKLAIYSDVCVFGAESLEYAVARARQNPSGLAFELSERWLKRGLINLLSQRLRKWWFMYQLYFRRANFYKLNSSAFAVVDYKLLHAYKNRQFKWGYFTRVDDQFDVQTSMKQTSTSEITSIMWCARFLEWKHPELPVKMAQKLRNKGYKFVIDYYGSGKRENSTKELVKKYDLEDIVIFHGNTPNNEVINAMRKHQIFLFTSDKNEGWGAVANESLSCGCVLVGSDAIGSIPHLVEDGVNGFKFKSCDIDDLTSKVEYLINHKEIISQMRINAQKRMTELWSPKHAAINLLQLIDDIQAGKPCSIAEGPCSRA